MSAAVVGLAGWALTIDDQGFRDYKADWKVRSNDVLDGPSVISFASGLPVIGSPWEFGNDVDDWCFCRPQCEIKPIINEERQLDWMVSQTFSNRPMARCQDVQIDNPLLEPFRIGGSFVTSTVEATHNYDGSAIRTSSWEVVRGSAVEKDTSLPTVNIGYNISDNPLAVFASMMHCLNDAPLWGLAPRCVKLSNCVWSRATYGVCTFYYIIDYEFQVDYNTFDRQVLDVGTRVLASGGNPANPRHFVAYKGDSDDEKGTVILKNGVAWNGSGSPGSINIAKYSEANLALLGLPLAL